MKKYIYTLIKLIENIQTSKTEVTFTSGSLQPLTPHLASYLN